MKLTNYIYHGPQSGVTLKVGDEELDVFLFPNREVQLPADHDYTKALLAQKLLTLAPTLTKAAKSEAKTAKEVK